jgi:hypothetical protein
LLPRDSEIEIIRIRTDAQPYVQRLNQRHIFIRQRKVEDLRVGRDAVAVDGFRNGGDAALNIPAQERSAPGVRPYFSASARSAGCSSSGTRGPPSGLQTPTAIPDAAQASISA